MFLHTPISTVEKNIAVFEFKSLDQGLKYANSLRDNQKLLEIIDFPYGGSAVIVTSATPLKAQFKSHSLETLKLYYNLNPYKIMDHFLVIENLKFVKLFEVLNICSQNDIEVVDIKNQRVYPKNSVLLSYEKSSQVSTLIKKFKGKKIEKLSSALRDFFHATKPT